MKKWKCETELSVPNYLLQEDTLRILCIEHSSIHRILLLVDNMCFGPFIKTRYVCPLLEFPQLPETCSQNLDILINLALEWQYHGHNNTKLSSESRTSNKPFHLSICDLKHPTTTRDFQWNCKNTEIRKVDTTARKPAGGVEWLNHAMVTYLPLFLIFELPNHFPNWLYHFTFAAAVIVPISTHICQHLIWSAFEILAILIGMKRYHYDFNLFPWWQMMLRIFLWACLPFLYIFSEVVI